MKTTKIVLSTFAFIFALGTAVITNVSAAADNLVTRVATASGLCVTIGTCTIGSNPCVTLAGTPLVTSGTCQSGATGSFQPFQ